MQKLIYAIFLWVAAHAETIFRLSTQNPTQMNPGDKLISTLGYFTATLQSNQCALSVRAFNDETLLYEEKGKFKSPTAIGNCEHLEIQDGKVVTNAGNTYISTQGESFNQSTVFTIDDEGVIRIIGTYIKENRVDMVSAQTNFTNFRIQQPYFRAFSSLKVDFMTRVPAISNKRKWKFIAQFGQLTIYFAENPAHKLDYVYSSITIRNNQLYDFSDQTFPGILYNNITFAPRCFEPRIYLDFKVPFVFAIDPYWPTMRVYEQGRYQLIDLSFGYLPQYDFQPGYSSFFFAPTYSPCPIRTFEYRGDCVPFCPQPFWHEMRGQVGKCVLNCEEGTFKDEEKRLCQCYSDYEKQKINAQAVKKCPSTSNPSPYGCYCKNEGQYYDQMYTFKCVRECPETTYPHNGICMNCPFNCKICQEDGFFRNFLECKQCFPGYKVYKGQCVKQCINNYGLSLFKEQCIKCVDNNCVNCENDPNVCLKCNLMTTLENGTCKDDCAVGSNAVYSQLFDSQCLAPSQLGCIQMLTSHYKGKPFLKCDMCMTGISHLDKCVNECPSGYYSHNNKYCACAGLKNMTIADECTDMPGCPATMSFDIRSHSCLSCPFGCMSCINTQCTSCNPGYFLYISPQSILCRRKSPLFPCDQQYQLVRGICRVKEFTDLRLQMTLCSTLIPDCQVCIPRSMDICVMCKENFYIYNNTCIDQCPPSLVPYENTCILNEIQNCALPHFSSVRQSAIVNVELMEASKPYKQYIYGNREPANDPIGYIPYFQKLTTQKSDGVPRQTDFFEPIEICLKCNDGLGMSDDFKSCLPCPAPCKTCFLAKSYSCLKVEGQGDGGNPGGGGNSSDCRGFIDSETGNCTLSCHEVNKFPEVDEGKLTCKQRSKASNQDYVRIDSAIYKNRDGTELVFFVFGDKIVNQSKKVNILVEKISAERRVLESQVLERLQIEDGSFVKLQNMTAGVYIMNLTGQLAELKSQNNLILPNQVYGTSDVHIHQYFMEAWLAYIGYLLSIVIIVLHIIYIGNNLLYKVDNLLIFAQSIFYFSFVKNLAGRLLAQFYFGWSFAHGRFLPNIFNQIIPDHYYEEKAPPSFKLMNVDANYFRNAGFSLGWMLIYVLIFLVIALTVKILLFQTKKKNELWYPKIAKQALIGGIEFFLMNLMFFSVAQLMYDQGGNEKNPSFYSSSRGMAIFTIIAISFYAILRVSFNSLGGIYTLKRVLLGVMLAPAYQNPAFIAPILILEVVFAIARFIIESPDATFQIVTIAAESGLFMGCYILMFLVLDAGVNTVIISIVVFMFIVYLAYDLTTIYLESRNEYELEEVEEVEEVPIKPSKIQNRYESKIEGSRQGSKLNPSRLENGSRMEYGMEKSERSRFSAIIHQQQ